MINSRVLLLCSLYALLNTSAALIMKIKLINHRISGPASFFYFLMDPKIICALLLLIVSMFVSLKTLSLAEFSFVIPLTTAINFIFTVLIGIYFFDDTLVAASYVGLALILSGVFILAKFHGG